MTNLKRVIVAVLLLGLIAGGIFAYSVYTAIFSPNTAFNNDSADIYIKTGSSFDQVLEVVNPLLINAESFTTVARKKGYVTNIKAGKYKIKSGMNNNEIINALRSQNIPVRLTFNNQETLAKLAGRISRQIEADSLDLLAAFTDTQFLSANQFTQDQALSIYIPNSYEFFWNTSAEVFRDRMYKEYQRFWNESRVQKAKTIGLTKEEVISLAAIVHEESKKNDERPRVAGVYLNRLKKGIHLQADPTVIFAIKKHRGDFNTVIKRVLYKDLELDSPYNTYKNAGLPPGPISMPDITAIDAVLNAEQHDYLYFVADVSKPGYHMFAKTLSQHNLNKRQYISWLDKKKIRR